VLRAYAKTKKFQQDPQRPRQDLDQEKRHKHLFIRHVRDYHQGKENMYASFPLTTHICIHMLLNKNTYNTHKFMKKQENTGLKD
jgi:hypothetical protein